MTGPTSDSGGMMALTREPSVRRASTIGRRLVDAAADRGDDPVDDAHDVVVVLEDDVRQLELAGALDVDLARAVDHDLGDGLVAQERLERAEADDLVGDLLEHPDALGAGQGEALLVDDLAEDLLDLAADLDLVGQVELRVQVLDDPALDPELDVPERLADRGLGDQPLGRRSPAAAPPAGPAGAAGTRAAPGAAVLPVPAAPVERFRSASAGTSTYTPFRPARLATGCSSASENSDFFWVVLRVVLARLRRPVHRRRTGPAGRCPGRPAPPDCERKKGTPRLSA